jgi:hypothetical protein
MSGTKIIRCKRCGKRQRNNDGWNSEFIAGYLIGYLCPACQTPEEDIEAAVREVVDDYSGCHQLPFNKDTLYEWADRYAEAYKTPDVLRAKANELLSARPELAKGPVALLKAVAADLEAGWTP